MPKNKYLLILVVALLIIGALWWLKPWQKLLGKVMISGTNLTASGKPFRVWGHNYTGPVDRLIEDAWQSEDGWSEIESDFSEMADLGTNTVRIHLQLNKFMNSTSEVNSEAIANLERLVKIAENERLYLIVTGLGAYKQADAPAWYDSLDETGRWAAHANFWQAISKAIGASPSVLAYDLMNEPVVAVDPPSWTPGKDVGGYYFVQNITRDAAGRDTLAVMRSWINTLKAAIRTNDTLTPITAGFLPFPNQVALASELDIMSTHIYPKRGQLDAANKLVAGFESAKPLVITETYPLETSADELKQFIEANNAKVSGWLGHYTGKPLAELTPPADIPEAIEKSWLELFKELAP